MIALLCPTRGRPQRFKRMFDSVERTSTNKIFIFAASNDPSDNYVNEKFPVDCPTVLMWNSMAKGAADNTSANLFMLAADDMIFSTPGWDKALIDHYNALENKIHVYALRDSRDPEGTPHPIVTREWIDAMGWFVPPYFLHWEIDIWTVRIANKNNCFTHMKDYELIHDKPSDRGMPDQTHLRIRQNGWRERDAYVAKSCSYLLEFEKQRLAKAMA